MENIPSHADLIESLASVARATGIVVKEHHAAREIAATNEPTEQARTVEIIPRTSPQVVEHKR
jgi:hypothetical protein